MIHFPQCSCNYQTLMRKSLQIFTHDKSPETCRSGQKWITQVGVPEDSSHYYETLHKINYDDEYLLASIKQINLDVSRTFLESAYFSKGLGSQVLQRVLYAIARYNPHLGYVQGMNYIVATLLYHCTESDAFWLFLKLVYNYELVENFLPQLPGLEKHSHIVEFLLIEHLPNLNEHLMQAGVIPQMYITEWCITLFTTLMNLEFSHLFLSKFFKSKWLVFYQFVVEILARLEAKLCESNNPVKIMDLLKPVKGNSLKASLAFLKTLETNEKLTWKRLIQMATKREVNQAGIVCLSENFESFLDVSKSCTNL